MLKHVPRHLAPQVIRSGDSSQKVSPTLQEPPQKQVKMTIESRENPQIPRFSPFFVQFTCPAPFSPPNKGKGSDLPLETKYHLPTPSLVSKLISVPSKQKLLTSYTHDRKDAVQMIKNDMFHLHPLEISTRHNHVHHQNPKISSDPPGFLRGNGTKPNGDVFRLGQLAGTSQGRPVTLAGKNSCIPPPAPPVFHSRKVEKQLLLIGNGAAMFSFRYEICCQSFKANLETPHSTHRSPVTHLEITGAHLPQSRSYPQFQREVQKSHQITCHRITESGSIM